jgi:sialidase-1
LAFSKDGGHNWDTAYVSKELPDPVCQGSTLSYTYRKQHLVFFSNAASTTKRENMTIRVSKDDGKTWPVAYVVDPGGASYSDLVSASDETIGLIYEKDEAKAIVYVDIPVRKLFKQ